MYGQILTDEFTQVVAILWSGMLLLYFLSNKFSFFNVINYVFCTALKWIIQHMTHDYQKLNYALM